jgi:hypothetical protein
MLITILLSAVGMIAALRLGTKDAAGIGAFALPAVKDLGFTIEAAIGIKKNCADDYLRFKSASRARPLDSSGEP